MHVFLNLQSPITNQSWRHVFFCYEIYMKLKYAWFEMKIRMANTGTRRFKHIMSVQIDNKDAPSFKKKWHLVSVFVWLLRWYIIKLFGIEPGHKNFMCDMWNLLSYPKLTIFGVNIDHYLNDRNQSGPGCLLKNSIFLRKCCFSQLWRLIIIL